MSLFQQLTRYSGLLVFCGLLGSCGEKSAASDSAGGEDSTDVSGEEAGAAPTRSAVSLQVVAQEARQGDLILRVNTKGAVYGDQVIRLAPEVSGTVAEVLVKPGSRVSKGQALVRLDGYLFDLAVREAQTALDEREQQFRESFEPESLVTGIGPTPDQRRALRTRSGVGGAEVRLERAKWEKEKTVLVSPADGYVDRVDLAVGERVNAGSTIITIVNLSALRIEAQVLEHDLPLIRTGGEALVSSSAIPGRVLRGRIDAVLPLVDSTTRVGRVLVRVPGEGSLRPGMYTDVQLEAQRLTGRTIVPSRAVIERDGRPLVFIVKNGRAQWTYIQPGRSNGIDTEVLPDSSTGILPVAAGDQIIIDGHLTLTHDASVTVSNLLERDEAAPVRTPAAARRNENQN